MTYWTSESIADIKRVAYERWLAGWRANYKKPTKRHPDPSWEITHNGEHIAAFLVGYRSTDHWFQDKPEGCSNEEWLLSRFK